MPQGFAACHSYGRYFNARIRVASHSARGEKHAAHDDQQRESKENEAPAPGEAQRARWVGGCLRRGCELIAHFILLEQMFDERMYKDRKSTRLNSSHVAISYAVFCLKNKKI